MKYPAFRGGFAIDGIDGPLTQAGVREFQEKFGLVVDGIAGPKTKAKLEEVHDK